MQYRGAWYMRLGMQAEAVHRLGALCGNCIGGELLAEPTVSHSTFLWWCLYHRSRTGGVQEASFCHPGSHPLS